jgi:peptide/nickel transport system ATP-binding protein
MNKVPVLEVKNLTTEFVTDEGVIKAVNDVSFTLHKGETLGIVGESGSGKSVTSLSIMRLVPSPPGRIAAGKIIYHSSKGPIDLLTLKPHEIRKHRGNNIAMIFQEPMTSLNPVYTCGDQVTEAILQHYGFADKNLFTKKTKNILRWALTALSVLGAASIFLTAFSIVTKLFILSAGIGFGFLIHRFLKDKKIETGDLKLEVPYYTNFLQIFLRSTLVALFSLGTIAAFFLEAGVMIKLLTSLTSMVNAVLIYVYVKTKREKLAHLMAIKLFEDTKLPNPERIFGAYPHQLSGGQKQRVMIAMAMACNPSVLIADEPTTALDVTVQKTILELMNDLQVKYNIGIIFITHDLGVIAEVAENVMVMLKGKIVEQGNVLDIFTNPKHPYTKGLLACRPSLQLRLRKLPVVSDFMKINEDDSITENTSYTVGAMLKLHEEPLEERTKRLAELYQQKPILEIKKLKTWFPTQKNILGKPVQWVKAVDEISLEVYPGETLGLVGESGCGKTTLGRTILRLTEPNSGEIFFEGKDITKFSANEMRKLRKDMQIIFQDPYSSLNPRMTIGEAIMEPMRVHGIGNNESQRRNKVIEILEKVNMRAAHFSRYPHEFSGGQRQRICIARALALEPKFIICDESVSALDVSVQAQVLNLLNDLKKEFGFTYIFISHDLSVVKLMSDRMVVMNHGVVEEISDADAVYNHPQSFYTKTLIEAIPKGEVNDIKKNLARKSKNYA